MGWQPNPYIVEGEAVARCRAAWGAGRPAAGWQGLFCKKFRRKFAPGSLEDRSPDSGAARCLPSGSGAVGPPDRPPAGRPPPPPLYKGLAATPPLICLTKNPEKKEKREGRERRGEGERRNSEALPDFQAGDCR